MYGSSSLAHGSLQRRKAGDWAPGSISNWSWIFTNSELRFGHKCKIMGLGWMEEFTQLRLTDAHVA